MPKCVWQHASESGTNEVELNTGSHVFRNGSSGDYYNQVGDQSLHDCNLIRNNINVAGIGDISYQALLSNDQFLNPTMCGLDLNNQRSQEGVINQPAVPQPVSRARFESNPIDFSQSLSQLLVSLADLNENPREGFVIVFVCTDTCRETIASRYNSHDERILKLEHSLLAMNSVLQGSHSLFLGLQAECIKIDGMITQHDPWLKRR